MRQLIFFISLAISPLITAGQSDYLAHIGQPDSLYSNVLGESREIYIQIPPGYFADTMQTYPVGYILDGEILLPALSVVHDFYSGAFMPEMVLIGISNRDNRTANLTPSDGNSSAYDFLRFIESELIPYVERNYRVSDYRMLIGHSYGGLFTIHTLIEKPDLFANYLSIDPSMDWDEQRFLKRAKVAMETGDFEGRSLFVSLSGQLNMQDYGVTIENVMQDTTELTLFARSNIEFSSAVQAIPQNGLQYYWRFYPDDLHGTIPLPSIRDGLLALFEWYRMENTDKINTPSTPVDELLEIVNHREQKLRQYFGYGVPPYPEFLLNMSGYMNLEMGQPEKSFMYFNLAIKYYPHSANAYDSMADYYISQGDTTKALEMVSKAYELSGSDYHKGRFEALKADE